VLKHPEVKEHVLKQVEELFAAGDLDKEGLLNKPPTLNGAIRETMRLYPIAVAQMRTANKDFEGHQIYAGEMIYIGTSVPHFMEGYWPRAKTFAIDRYRKPRAEHLQPGVYSPYGRGPHTCLGKSLAEVQMALSVARGPDPNKSYQAVRMAERFRRDGGNVSFRDFGQPLSPEAEDSNGR
jgi:cytochrome P450